MEKNEYFKESSLSFAIVFISVGAIISLVLLLCPPSVILPFREINGWRFFNEFICGAEKEHLKAEWRWVLGGETKHVLSDVVVVRGLSENEMEFYQTHIAPAIRTNEREKFMRNE